jgi:hypothetical protein
MTQDYPLFITEDVITEIGRWYAVYPYYTREITYIDKPYAGKNSIHSNLNLNISPAHLESLKIHYICANTYILESGLPIQRTHLKSAHRVMIIDCTVYSQIIRTAHAQFVARHHRKKSEKRIALTLALLNKNIDIYFAMSIARQYLP